MRCEVRSVRVTHWVQHFWKHLGRKSSLWWLLMDAITSLAASSSVAACMGTQHSTAQHSKAQHAQQGTAQNT